MAGSEPRKDGDVMEQITILIGLAALLLLVIVPRLKRRPPLGLGIGEPESRSETSDKRRAA